MPRKTVSPNTVHHPPDQPFCIEYPMPARAALNRYVSWVLATLGGDKDVAARVLKLSKKTVYNRIKDVQNL